MSGNVNLRIPGGSRFAGYISSRENTSQAKHMVMQYETSDGKKGELQWGRDMLASVGGIGGTVNAKYHEGSTAEDPVAVVWGTDQSGKEYQHIVHLNEIDPSKATAAEMMALYAHLSKRNGGNAESPIALWTSKSAGADLKMDYEKYYRDYIAMQRQGGDRSSADMYQLQLERFLFFCQQNRYMRSTAAETGNR